MNLLKTINRCLNTRILPIVLWLTLLFPSYPPSSYARETKCLRWIKDTDSLMLTSPSGGVILARNASQPRTPASILKVLTSLAAISELGLDFRFKTEFYLQNGRDLVVKGYGDPLLISEVISDIALQLSHRLKAIHDIITDNTYFSYPIKIPGRGHSTNPYDAPPSALCVNFNTIMVARDVKGRVISGEPQTPLTPLAVKIAKKIRAGTGRYTIGEDPGLAATYAGELLRSFLAKEGIHMDGHIRPGVASSGAELIYTHYSPFTLQQLIQKMLKFSSNFMANQLLLTMGAIKFGAPATLDKGLRILRNYAQNKLGLTSVVLVEGSGISRKNRISAIDMIKVLTHFMRYHRLMRRRGNTFYKTGTLKGIRTCVGYILDGNGNLYPFVVFINRPFYHLDSIIRCLQGLVPDGG